VEGAQSDAAFACRLSGRVDDEAQEEDQEELHCLLDHRGLPSAGVINNPASQSVSWSVCVHSHVYTHTFPGHEDVMGSLDFTWRDVCVWWA